MKCTDCLRTQLTAKISIERAVQDVTADGDAVVNWALIAQPWAKVEHVENVLADREGFASGQKFAELQTNFTVRFSSSLSVTSKDRVSWDGDEYEIINTFNAPPGRPTETVMHTTKRTD